MKIESPNESKIIVELSDEDMTNLDITYDELDYSNIETRRVIWTILAKARKLLGRDIDPSGEMTIETLPSGEGGCMILFTVPEDTAQTHKTLPIRVCRENHVYEFKNLNDVIDLYAALKKSEIIQGIKASLYFDGNKKYRLVFERMPDTGEVKRTIKEYSVCCGEGDVSAERTKEFWNKISSNLFC